MVFATDGTGNDDIGEHSGEEEKKSTGNKKKTKDAKVDAKAKSKKKEPNKENVLNKCAAQVKGKEITTLEEFADEGAYYLVYSRQKTEKEHDIETKVSAKKPSLRALLVLILKLIGPLIHPNYSRMIINSA